MFTQREWGYEPDCISRYRNLHTLSGFVLLESVDKSRGRYDIVTACPYLTLTYDPELHSPESFFEAIKAHLPHHPAIDALPFIGGAIGYFSYDFGEALWGIEREAPSAIPLAVVRFYDWALVVDHEERTTTVVALNQHTQTKRLIDTVHSLWHKPEQPVAPTSMRTPLQPTLSSIQHQQAIHAILGHLNQGRCYQVNYTMPFKGGYQGESFGLYERIRAKNPVPFSAYFSLGEQSILSFSPERLLRHRQGELLSSPIKGSMHRHEEPDMDKKLGERLCNSEKNRAENTMIVDMVRNDLSQVSEAGSVHVHALCELRSFPKIHHLVSDITARLKPSVHPVDAFKACFPGASITGAPKKEAMKVIAELEPEKRGIYCGSIAYFSAHGDSDSHIAIRTLLDHRGQLILSAGGGIVIASEPHTEYEECLTKVAAIQEGLASCD